MPLQPALRLAAACGPRCGHKRARAQRWVQARPGHGTRQARMWGVGLPARTSMLARGTLPTTPQAMARFARWRAPSPSPARASASSTALRTTTACSAKRPMLHSSAASVARSSGLNRQPRTPCQLPPACTHPWPEEAPRTLRHKQQVVSRCCCSHFECADIPRELHSGFGFEMTWLLPLAQQDSVSPITASLNTCRKQYSGCGKRGSPALFQHRLERVHDWLHQLPASLQERPGERHRCDSLQACADIRSRSRLWILEELKEMDLPHTR